MDIIITVNRLHVKKYFFLAVKILIIIWIRYLKLKYFSLIIGQSVGPDPYTHLRAHETARKTVSRLLLETQN